MKIRHALLALPALAALPLAFAPAASAAQDGTYTVPLNTSLNGSGATGTAILTLHGDQLKVVIDSTGLVPNAPHAQHLHGDTSGKNFTCPTTAQVAAADTNHDGHLSTTEAGSFYGPVMISLTTTGDTSMKSGLAVSRFPVADAQGNLHYERTITLDPKVAKDLTNLHIVQHGVDYNGNGTYDGAAKSDLDPSLPAEATDPADCGAIEVSQMSMTPNGGVQTGIGPADPMPSSAAIVLGGAALAGAGATGVVAARRRRTAGGSQGS